MVSLNNLEEDTATVTYASGLEFEGRRIGDVYPIAHSAHEEVARTRAGLLVQPEAVEELEGRFSTLIPTFRAGLRSMMSVPLISRDQVIGALHLRSKKAKAYTDRNLRLAQRIGAQIAGAIANARLFADSKRAQEELRESEERYRNILDNIEDGYFEVDTAGNFTFFNDALCSNLGYSKEEMMGINNRQYMDKENAKKVYQAFVRVYTTGETYKAYGWAITRKDGTKRIHESSVSLIRNAKGEPIGFRGVSRDVTERKKVEEERNALQLQLHQAQKMEAIGTLAGGIAHDFNNILAAIMGFAELASLDLQGDSKAKYNVQQSIMAAHRAKNLVQQILAFSRQRKQERKPLNIQPIVKEALKFLRASLPATIEIRQNTPEDLGTIEADPTEVYQVLMNLCTNATHAMDENGGVLEVSLSQVDIPAEAPAVSRGIEPGTYVRLRVSDTGHGLPPEILKKIFDPYFTTKEVGKGTGLGLAVVHGIVKSYGGEISVSSGLGKGSTFDIYFPRVQDLGRPLEAEKAEPLPFGGHERVLFVDDEKAIAEIGESMLKHLGYEAEVRTSSIEALELFRVQADRFDLVITDMAMPNMTGDKLAQELLRIRPGIPIILCTGFSEYLTEEKAKALGIQEFVMKPLVMKDLAVVIRRALDRKKKSKDEMVMKGRGPGGSKWLLK
jgi:PAS domain S-box-containing protein